MTEGQIIHLFTSKEAAGNRTPRGADHAQIVREIAAESGRTEAEVRRIILDATFMGPV